MESVQDNKVLPSPTCFLVKMYNIALGHGHGNVVQNIAQIKCDEKLTTLLSPSTPWPDNPMLSTK